ncbi:tetratricopeptide repeat protein [Stieleria marina]|uniref:TPR repeat-containing protein YrrB n=1 Tax=Stieleria marina TaxID=1930275 RepID=A0A517NVB9_9BACT|nr:TPR repeat-containing protein YrrB [Planctomycetes bacterium K23_9]
MKTSPSFRFRSFCPTIPGNRSLSRSLRQMILASVIAATAMQSDAKADAPYAEPVVARVEMKLTDGEDFVDVIEPGDLLTVIEEREKDYVVVTHDGTKGAVSKVNAVRIAESGDVYSELITRNPKEGRLYTLRASSFWALGKAEEALADFDKAIELGYDEPHAYTSRGLFHAAMGKHEAAIKDYNKAIVKDPDDAAPYINRAAVYMQKGSFASAADDYTTALESNKGDAGLLHQRAIAWKSAGELEKALADFDSIVAKNKRDITAVMGRGYIKFQQGNHSEAIKDFAAAIELNPKDAVARNNRGYNRFQVGEFAGALEDYDAAIKLAPKYALALQNRAWLLATVDDSELRDPVKAVDSARIACELSNFQNVGDVSALAASLAAAGKFEDALGWQEKVVEMVAEDYKEFAQKTLERYEAEKTFASDPDKANEEERLEAEKEAKAKQARKAANKEADEKA